MIIFQVKINEDINECVYTLYKVKLCQCMCVFQGDYIWIEPISGREFDVAIGARVISAEGRRIQVKDDDNQVNSIIVVFQTTDYIVH